MSYFEQVLEEEQLPVTSQNKSSSLSSLQSLTLFINLSFHFREFTGVISSDRNQILLSGSHCLSLQEMLYPSHLQALLLGHNNLLSCINQSTHSAFDLLLILSCSNHPVGKIRHCHSISICLPQRALAPQQARYDSVSWDTCTILWVLAHQEEECDYSKK